MNATIEAVSEIREGEVELVTFHVGDLLLGADIRHVEEINRHVDLTPVAQSHPSIRGVMTLRGEVVTVFDLGNILGLGRTEIGPGSRNVIVNSEGERIGLLVDRIADVVNTQWSEIKPPPVNVAGVDRRFFEGVYELGQQLLAVLNIDEVLTIT